LFGRKQLSYLLEDDEQMIDFLILMIPVTVISLIILAPNFYNRIRYGSWEEREIGVDMSKHRVHTTKYEDLCQ
jgi:hypothetical protein